MVAGRITGAVWFRMIFFLPYILADVAAGLIWHFMFDGGYGLTSVITGALGLEPYYLLADKTWAFSAMLIVILWKYFGFYTMLYVAGLQGIDRSLLEAAGDGRGDRLSAFPAHHPAAARADDPAFDLLFGGWSRCKLFDIIVPLTGGGPFETTNTMVSYLYYFGITRMRVGYRLGGRRRAVRDLRDLRLRLQTALHAR